MFADFPCVGPHEAQLQFSHTDTHARSFHPQLYYLSFYVLINQSGKSATSKPSAYIESPTQMIYSFITLAVLLQTFHLKGSESCSAFEFLLGGAVSVFLNQLRLFHQKQEKKKK